VSLWQRSWRADPRGRVLADRHYSRKTPGAAQFVPPGECVVLLTPAADALWVTSAPYAEFVMHDWAGAWTCSLFRNEGPLRSSDLIRSAIAATLAQLGDAPPLGMVTMVDRTKVRPKRHPGYCFLMAGFRHVGQTKDQGLDVLQLLPAEMPAPEPAYDPQLALAFEV
jgi:hypothetical protein